MTHNHIYSDKDCAKCKPKHPKPQKILLECGEGTGSRIFTSSNDTPFQLAHITLDTTCLNRPEVLIKFSSLVNFTNLSIPTDQFGTVRLQYELFRVFGKEEAKSLGIWMFEEVNVFRLTSSQTESFNFIFCESTKYSRSCDYFVTVTPVEITNATATISNGRMAALSQSSRDFSKEECKIYETQYEEIKFKQKHSVAKEILFECGMGNGSVVFRDFPSQPPAKIAHVNINTTCLSKPKALIEFSSIIKIDADIADVRLQFELFRVCGEGEPLSLGNWPFERNVGIDGEDVELEKAFSFIFCDCKVPSNCCEYFVTVTPIEIVDREDDETPDVTIANVRIAALAQSSRKDINYDDCKVLNDKVDYMDCKPEHPKPKKILLECGSGNGSRTFTSSNDPAFQLAQVTIDTTSLCKPILNIEFSSIVSFERLDFNGNVQLRYELFRVCGKKRPTAIGIWVWERIDLDDLDRSTNTFDFTFCSCIVNPSDCCDYFVVVTPVEITEGVSTVTVSNGRMAALAGEG